MRKPSHRVLIILTKVSRVLTELGAAASYAIKR